VSEIPTGAGMATTGRGKSGGTVGRSLGRSLGRSAYFFGGREKKRSWVEALAAQEVREGEDGETSRNEVGKGKAIRR
jgi:hypothetical protein